MNGRRVTVFIIGTDTGVGKTFAACGLLEAARARGLSTAAVKPVAAGAVRTAQGLRNRDALALLHRVTLPLAYEQVNPVCLEAPVAPHIAATETGKDLRVSRLAGFCRGVMMLGADFTVIEGAGGWYVPLNRRELLCGLVKELNVPVILVVGMKLGCLNHALLTARAVLSDRVTLAGWIANRLDPEMTRYEENRETLTSLLPAPLLGEIGHYPDFTGETSCAADLDIETLL